MLEIPSVHGHISFSLNVFLFHELFYNYSGLQGPLHFMASACTYRYNLAFDLNC